MVVLAHRFGVSLGTGGPSAVRADPDTSSKIHLCDTEVTGGLAASRANPKAKSKRKHCGTEAVVLVYVRDRRVNGFRADPETKSKSTTSGLK